jgi:hypothetical protein
MDKQGMQVCKVWVIDPKTKLVNFFLLPYLTSQDLAALNCKKKTSKHWLSTARFLSLALSQLLEPEGSGPQAVNQ